MLPSILTKPGSGTSLASLRFASLRAVESGDAPASFLLSCCVVCFAALALLLAVVVFALQRLLCRCLLLLLYDCGLGRNWSVCVPAPCGVKHCKLDAHGLLSFLSLLRAILLNAIKRNQVLQSDVSVVTAILEIVTLLLWSSAATVT